MKFCPLSFLILAVVLFVASSCSRSQAPLPVSVSISSTPIEGVGPASTGTPTVNLSNTAALKTLAGLAMSTQVALTRETTEPLPSHDGPPSATATRSRQPNPVSDLLYLTQDHLKRWDPLTRHAISLAQNVTDFAVSEDGNVIILLRPQKIIVNGIQPFNLDALQLRDQQIFTLIDNTLQPKNILVSPDGKLVAYTQMLTEGQSIFILPVKPGAEPQKLGECKPEPAEDCLSIAWSPDSRNLLWSDSLGLWQAPTNPEVKVEKSQLILPSQVQVKDPKGQNLTIDARFSNLKFAPNGRFVLLKVAPLASQVGWQAVFDRRSGLLAQARDTFAHREIEADAIWQSNGNLLVGHASEPARHIPPFIHVWLVLPTNPELLVSGQQFELYSDDFPFSTAQSKAIPSHCLLWMTELEPDHLVFAIQLEQTDDTSVLFDLNLRTGMLTKLYELPVGTTQVLWSPDGVNALILGGRNQILSLSLKNGELINLEPILGPDAHLFVWLPPHLRR